MRRPTQAQVSPSGTEDNLRISRGQGVDRGRVVSPRLTTLWWKHNNNRDTKKISPSEIRSAALGLVRGNF
jgi:hypothetical protein